MREIDATDTFEEITGASLPEGYSLIRYLGEGRISRVFLVRNVPLRRLVVLKVLRKKLAGDPLNQKRFMREAQAAARIAHPSVVSIYTVGQLDNGLPFIEMQHIDGRSLGDKLEAQGRLETTEVRSILAQLAGALRAAHGQHIVHRGLDPSSVLLDRDGDRVFLTDFGIAGILETGTESVTKLTREDERLGNPAYMSPEQLRGEPLTVESDIYGFGLLGYEMFTLCGPFGDADISDIAGAHIRRSPINLHEAYADIPEDLGSVLKRCLSKKPQNRPTAQDLVDFFDHGADTERRTSDDSQMPLPGAVAGFLGELQDRKVYRAAVAYGALIFALLQVADLVFPPLNISDWVYRLLVIASLSAFPFVLALAWIFDWREGRLTRTEDEDGSFESRASPRQQFVLQLFGLMLSVVASAAIAWWLLRGG